MTNQEAIKILNLWKNCPILKGEECRHGRSNEKQCENMCWSRQEVMYALQVAINASEEKQEVFETARWEMFETATQKAFDGNALPTRGFYRAVDMAIAEIKEFGEIKNRTSKLNAMR